MAINENSLCVKTILSPIVDIDVTIVDDKVAQRQQNRATLQNRVKKLTQRERSELMGVLDKLFQASQQSLSIPGSAPPIPEKGLFALLLQDDGVQVAKRSFITSFFLGLMNFLNGRISSAVVLNNFEKVRKALIEPPISTYSSPVLKTRAMENSSDSEVSNLFDSFPNSTDPIQDSEVKEGWTRPYHIHDKPIDVAKILSEEINALEALQARPPFPSQQLNPFIQQIVNLNASLNSVADQNWANPLTFLTFETSLAKFQRDIGKACPELAISINTICDDVKEIVRSRRGNNLKSLATELIAKTTDYKNIQSFSSFEECYRDLQRISRGEQVVGKIDFKYWEKNLIIPYIQLKLEDLKKILKDVIASFEAHKEEERLRLEIVKERLEKYLQNTDKKVKQNKLAAARLELSGCQKKLNQLETICGMIQVLESVGNESLEDLILHVQTAEQAFATSSDADLKGVGNFDAYLACLAQFTKNTSHQQGLADLIDLKILNGFSIHQELLNRLNHFKKNLNRLLFDSDESKKQFINDNITYLSLFYNKMKENKEADLAKAREKVNRLNSDMQVKGNLRRMQHPLPLPLPLPPSIPPALLPLSIIPLPSPPPSSFSVGLFTVPCPSETRYSMLSQLANQVQANRDQDHLASPFYQQLNTSVDQGLANQVYGNFYWIMRDLGKLSGPLKDGHAQDSHWGKNVFLKGKSEEYPPDIDPNSLNHYRVQAMVEVLENKIRNSAHQIF